MANELRSMADLTQTLDEILHQYRWVEQALIKMASQSESGGWEESVSQTVQEHLASVHELGQRAMAFYHSLNEGQRRSDACKAKMIEITEQVARTLVLVQRLESSARAERDQLSPQVHEGVRALQMQQAYSSQMF